MNIKLIEKLEQTTPVCRACQGATHIIPGTAYRILRCDNCGQPAIVPSSLTHTIIAAYNLQKITKRKRIQPCILQA